MLKRRLNGKTLASLIVLLMTVCASAFAGLRDESWAVNPSDYRYDMSLYFDMDGQDFEDMSSFEIGAFVDDECRGLAEKLELPDGGSCLYMRIRSNQAEGEKLAFYMKDKKTGQIFHVRGEDGSELEFKADSRIGLPSEPFMMEPYFTATFKIDGEVVKTLEVGYNDPIDAPEAPEKEGYTFNGWGDVPAAMPAYDIEFHSSYTVNSYKLTFLIGEDEIYSGEVAYGSAIIVPEAPAKEGYVFAGWGDVPATMPAKDLVFNGSYDVLRYNLIYKIDGEMVHSEFLAYGEKITPFNDVPQKTGHTFSGWSEIPETMPARDVDVNGSYVVNHYTVSFTLDGETISKELAYGEEIVQPVAPAKEGYTFSGWGDVPATMPDSDLSFAGSYTINTYTATFRIDQEVFQTLTLEYGAEIVAPEAPEKEGHTFSGWGDVPATMPANDLVFVGTYATQYYTIVFKVDDQILKQADLAYGTDIIVPDAPEKEGYTFTGWGDVPATMPAYDLYFNASYTVNNYLLTFKIDDEVVFEGQMAFGSEIAAPEAPAKEGNTFSGWGIVPATMPASDLVISGTYTPNFYALTFLIDGEVHYTTQVAYGAAIEAPEAPAKEGYTLTGWDDVPATMPAYDLNISGTFNVNSYKLTFRIDDEVIFSGDLNYGTEILAPEAPAKEGYTFGGWGMVPATMPASDLEIAGAYTVNIYNLTFVVDGETIYTSTQAYGTEIVAPFVDQREGHTFAGWTDMPATMPAGDLTVNGTYTVNHYTLTFRIGDEVIASKELAYGEEIILPEAADKEGYSFSGWGDVPAAMPAQDLTFEGSYSVNSYSVTFRIDQEVFQTLTLEYGADIAAPEAPEQEGRSFSGWGEVPATMPAHDLVFVGTYTDNYYTITFRIGDEIIKQADLAYGAEIIVPEAAGKEGHTFSGWGEVPATMPAANLDITGSYSVNSYKLTYSIDGEVVSSADVAFGTEIVAPEAAAKEGYTFSGWGTVPATMPAADLEINGTYLINHYTLTFKIGDEVLVSQELAYGEEIIVPEAAAREGHSFSGWGEVPAAMPAQDLTFEGSYSVNSYTVTFRIDQEVVETLTLAYGSEIVAPEVSDKEGHTFSGWGEVPATMPAHDLVFVGTYADNYYTLIFRIGDEIVKQADLAFGAEVIVPDVPEKEGHTFSGWGEVPATMPASNLEFIGSYSVNSYSLTFRIDDEVVYTAEVAYGADITAPEAAAKEGHSFSGWGIVPATMPASDLVISGTYLIDSYTLSFAIDGEVYYSDLVAYGSAITAPEAPAKEGYTFNGWGDVPATMPAADAAFEGSYTVNTYTVTFRIDQEVFETQTLAYGSAITAPEAPAKEGRSFSGWGEVPATMPAQDLVFVGTYTDNYYTITFRVGDEIVKQADLAYGATILLPEMPEKEGHTFSGWGEVPATMPAENLEVSGSYSVNTYSLTFRIDDEVVYTAQLAYGSDITAPEAAAREGHTFSGWGIVPATMPASDVVISGTYLVNTYTLTFVIDGEIFSTTQVAYGSAVEAPEVPAKDGNSFSGWGDVPATMPANDLTLNGTYSANTYTLTFKIGDEVVSTAQVAYGASITAPEAPAREGHTFSGWGVVPATMPAQDLVLTGSYEVNSYAVVFRIGGEIFHSAQLAYGSPVEVPEVPAREGHTFSGWGEVPATMPAKDLEFNGSYDVNVYTIVFRIGDDIVSKSQLAYGAAITAPEAAAKEGHTFSGWGVVPATMPASDLEFTGAYEVNYYNVTFKINGNVAYSAQLAYGSAIDAPAAPDHEGYTFSGWSEYPATVPAHDVEVNGSYTVNSYVLTVYLNGEVYLQQTIAYGAEVVIPDPVAGQGMKFDGWQEEVPATMPAHDVEIHGTISEDGTTWINCVMTNSDVTVYTIGGVLLYDNEKAADIKDRLLPGFYIINGQTMMVK